MGGLALARRLYRSQRWSVSWIQPASPLNRVPRACLSWYQCHLARPDEPGEDGVMTVAIPNALGTRRAELAAFLRSRRERITPEDVGLAPGIRRRTAGLRREEVAMLAGVGVTWYTWLEQGRPIKASTQLLAPLPPTPKPAQPHPPHPHRPAPLPP